MPLFRWKAREVHPVAAMMWIMRLLQHGVKGIINIIDFFVSFLFDNDNSSSSTSLTTGSTSSFKQHQSGSNLAALEALPPHFHRQHQAVHNQNISHIALSLPLQSTPQPSAQHPPYPHNHHGATYNQRHVLFHRKKSDDYDHIHSTTYQYHGENHTPTIHADNAREGGSSMMTHDQSVFFSVDDQQYQVWKQLNQNVHSNPVQRANNTPTAIEYDSSFTPISGSIHIDIDRLASIQQQAILPTATATNLQHNTTNVHRRGSKNIHVVIPPTTPLHPTPSTTTIPAAYPGGPGVAASGRLSTASPEITKRKVGGSSPSQNSSQHPDNHNIGVKPQHHHPIVIDTVPSMLQKQISGETQTVSQQMSNDSTIATLNRGIRGSQPLVRLNRLTLLEAAKTPPQTNSFIKKKSNDLTSSSIFSMDVAKMSLLLPIISFQDLIGADDKRNRLGGGAFGQVYRGVWKGTPVAIKILSSIDDDFQQYDGEAACDMPSKVLSAFEEEVTILAQLRHPNICLLLGVCVEQHRKAIVTELVSRGSLWDALRQKQSFQVFLVFELS